MCSSPHGQWACRSFDTASDAEQAVALLGVPLDGISRWRREAAPRRWQKAGLRHSPAVRDRDPVLVRECIEEARGRRGSCDNDALECLDRPADGRQMVDETLPDRGYAGCVRGAMGIEGVRERRTVQLKPRKDHRGAGHRARERKSPGRVRVIERHDHARTRGRPQVEHVGGARRHGVQYQRPMAAQHALGIARRAGGVAERRGRAFVEARIGRDRLRRGDEIFVGDGAGRDVGREFVGGTKRHAEEKSAAGLRDCVRQRFVFEVVEQSYILGVLRDERHLLRKETRVDGMANGADGRDREVGLHVLLIVPGERRDAISAPHARGDQRAGELAYPALDLVPVRTVEGAVATPRDDRRVGVVERGVRERVRDEQRPILNQTEHGGTFVFLRQSEHGEFFQNRCALFHQGAVALRESVGVVRTGGLDGFEVVHDGGVHTRLHHRRHRLATLKEALRPDPRRIGAVPMRNPPSGRCPWRSEVRDCGCRSDAGEARRSSVRPR